MYIQTSASQAKSTPALGVAEPSAAIAAFVFGSVAKTTDTAASDIDLMVISDKLAYADLYGALEATSTVLGRTVNPTILTGRELARRLKAKESFITRVLAQPKIWIVGDDGALGA